jgi:predicted PP-loop superfamily ATPase
MVQSAKLRCHERYRKWVYKKKGQKKMTIKNTIMGMKTINTYSAVSNKNDKGIFTMRPSIKKDRKTEWIEILNFEGSRININNSDNSYRINISEDKEVYINKTVFRADKNEVYLYSTEEVEVIELNKEEAEAALMTFLRAYNKQEIERDNNLMTYCRVHKLDVESTDVTDLRAIVKNKSGSDTCTSTLTSYPFSATNAYITYDGSNNTLSVGDVPITF